MSTFSCVFEDFFTFDYISEPSGKCSRSGCLKMPIIKIETNKRQKQILIVGFICAVKYMGQKQLRALYCVHFTIAVVR